MNWFYFLKGIKKYDFSFFIISFLIFSIGILNLYSATHTSTHMAGLYKMQLLWYVLSLFAGLGVSFFRPKDFFQSAWVFYFFVLFLLVVVLLLGQEGMGAKRWLVFGSLRIQPSEIMKVALILVLARWIARRIPDQELGVKELVVPMAITIVPIVLIAMGPDLGTALVLLLMFSVVIFYKKIKWKTAGIFVLAGLVSGPLMYHFKLKEYQKKRIMTFLNPGQDSQGSGYNAIQSKIAIGSGQLVGKGLMKSSQASLQYLPENHTDFIFSIFSEEHGFLGALLIITLYAVLLMRFLWLADSVPRVFDATVLVGLMSMFFWHIFINMSMVTGMMPIVGLPLPYMSYGGSSLLAFNLCCGMATSISNSRNLF